MSEPKQSRTERGPDRRKRKSLSEELHAMTREQLIERAMEMWGGWGYTQALLYKQIRKEPRPIWADENPHFRRLQEFPSLVIYEYHRSVAP